jgi:hypothetical protein
MGDIELGKIIAERHFRLGDGAGDSTSVRVVLGAPRAQPGGLEWHCPWQILGVGNEKIRGAYGVDSFQCLQLVMMMIGAVLYRFQAEGESLSWNSDQAGDLGFPHP